MDQIGDRDDLDAVFAAEFEQIAISVQEDAFSDFTAAERERAVNDLLRIKANLTEALRRDAEELDDEPAAVKRAAGGRHG